MAGSQSNFDFPVTRFCNPNIRGPFTIVRKWHKSANRIWSRCLKQWAKKTNLVSRGSGVKADHSIVNNKSQKIFKCWCIFQQQTGRRTWPPWRILLVSWMSCNLADSHFVSSSTMTFDLRKQQGRIVILIYYSFKDEHAAHTIIARALTFDTKHRSIIRFISGVAIFPSEQWGWPPVGTETTLCVLLADFPQLR